MQLHTLKHAPGALKKRKRVGRGCGSGRGRTSTRGNNGAKSRSGFVNKFGFEGGQTPLFHKLPIIGFKSYRKRHVVISLDDIERIVLKTGAEQIDAKILTENRKLPNENVSYKVLGNGVIKNAVNVIANGFSEKAKQIIESVGGTATIV